ncbi:MULTISPECIES: LytR/AlgR family response regulator transcription factor [Croceitalea]|uniref:LytTR family DNA-binding domain-containing protein n=1 Tax=Croceitalea vernalis TaxID=3075599 RepID=A0ABU3BH91_9FLAO|nr:MULTISPECIES: LytTR family DNA-binding domain-containing protein [unclassified Croceitalea]MDT0539715.1 LytTR family DNA-binding domain-containing protein [Croceitalea sp. P059]MDT0621529.1 LytTR family DNA-binding domain-containing protein [Croceitalea sp. P007]
MRIAIIEDEPLAAEKLERYLLKYDTNIEVLSKLNSLETAIPWIVENKAQVDLFFMDVQLSDGLSFEIFSQVTINKPVIFTTAFDEFAVDAFKVNSIDYLLKPITFTDLSRALKKLAALKEQFSHSNQITPILTTLGKRSYKDRFLVKIGNHIKSIPVEDIIAFQAEGRDVSLFTKQAKEYIIEYKLEVLAELVDPKLFYRVNRGFVVALKAINDVMVFSNRRLKLTLAPNIHKEIVVSREKVSDFKKWFEGS